MYDYCYFYYRCKTRMLENEPELVSETALVIDDDYYFDRRIGTVLSEAHKWENFLETDYKCSDGTSVKNRELPDGRRMSEFYDSVMGEYECNVFDEQGTLLVKDKCDRNGNYETAERMPDGTLQEESGTSIFIRCIDGKMI